MCGRDNEDTDLCLRVLARSYCTVLFNAFCIDKKTTMTMRGGNSDELYLGDGRTHMARALERAWPRVVETKRRWRRSAHIVRGNWRGFDTPLRPRPGVDLASFEPIDEFGMTLIETKPVEAAGLRKVATAYRRKTGRRRRR